MGPDKTTCLTIPAKSRALEGIRHYILSHDLQAGDCLPPERDLAQMLGVSRTALRGAIAALVGSYELTSRQGSGTYVADRPLVEVFQETSSYTDAGQKSGVATSSRVLESRLTTAPASVSERLKIAPDEPTFYLRRLRNVDGVPCALETVWVNYRLCPGIEDHDLSRESLYQVLEDDYGVAISHGDERVSLIDVTEEEAAYLRWTPGDAAFLFEAVEMTDQFVPVEVARHVLRPDRYRFASEQGPESLKVRMGELWPIA